ncbi:uncharacterized protein BO80DRAFT_400647 [Aspergillus ibericus CBS 121593]|uniref:Uncharacterized protein n=1 Tax=Aspergillus ibericus CBS 121593 TaxID=1448316 RepID=A0A395H989_9EURO|nr:hypothetical protein BO80DRAFT_400647 [Aspergillus ibericus CBS 121593]RAL04240.1 hypothetical protein BO80DRAFT_400647 [Aspergillus ibericus CBS 121593]
MGDGDASLPPSQERRIADTELAYQSDDSDESDSANNVTWAPGDGICPSTAQFNRCCEAKFDQWSTAASTPPPGSESSQYYIQSFLDLLQDVPSFLHSPPKDINIAGGRRSYLTLTSTLQIQTTDNPDCDQPEKPIDYYQCLGRPSPATYETKADTPLPVAIPVSANPLRAGYLTNIVLAWSYIISSRWVEIMQLAGMESQMLLDHDTRIEECFWDIVTQSGWVARVKWNQGVFYSPWMLRSEDDKKERRGDRTPVASNSSLAFDILLDFCVSEGLEGELIIGLAAVLFLTSRNAPSPKFAPPILNLGIPRSSTKKELVWHQLFQSIDKCMFLSCTQDALDSVLCSVFFDPSIPCNLMGAASLGVRKALSKGGEVDLQQLLNAITNIKPQLSILWAGVLCSHQATSFLKLTFRNLPPINLAAALWTNTAQSFLQIAYESSDVPEPITPRANEFQTSYFCRSVISVPWSPAPPFGATPISNLSLEVRAHLAHIHIPRSWRIYWNLTSGKQVPASATHYLTPVHIDGIHQSYSTEHANEMPYPESEQRPADEQSWAATSRLFNWHRGYDDGIWLDDGSGDVDAIRRRQRHAWMVDPFDDDSDEEVEETKHRELDVEGISRWKGEVERFS